MFQHTEDQVLNCISRKLPSGLLRAGAVVLLAVLLFSPVPLYAEWALLHGSRAHPEYRGAVPKKSDVVFSTRTKRPEALAIAKAFGATRVEWAYIADKKYIDEMKAVTHVFGAAISPYEINPPSEAVAKDFDGESIQNPQMSAWPGMGTLLTTTSPLARKIIFEKVSKYIAAGAAAIQVDGPAFQVMAARNWPGDFNPATLDGFRRYVNDALLGGQDIGVGLERLRNIDYRSYLRDTYNIKNKDEYGMRYKSIPSTPLWDRYLKWSVEQFYTELRSRLKSLRPEGVALSMNLINVTRPDQSLPDFFLTRYADYFFSELLTSDPMELILRSATAHSLGLGFVGTMISESVPETRTAIALLYALGSHPVVPWDVYLGNDTNGMPRRYFGRVAEYADLFRFVRKNAVLFDEYELATVVGIPIPTSRFSKDRTIALTKRLVALNVPFSFISLGADVPKQEILRVLKEPKVLALVNDQADFEAEDLRMIQTSEKPILSDIQMTDTELMALAPVRNMGNSVGKVLVVPRVHREGMIVLHVIQPFCDMPNKGESICVEELEINEDIIPYERLNHAMWVDHEGSRKIELNRNKIKIPRCGLWGILALQ